MQLAGITNNRPSTLLAVYYQHIKVTLLLDPNNKKQPRVLIEIVFQHTKGYLKKKDAYVPLFYVIFPPNLVCITVADDIIEINSRFQMSRTSRAYCFVLTSQCSLYFFQTKLSLPLF